jgi:hypothetical protein
VKLKELQQPEWIKKVDIQNLIIYKNYVNSLPNKSLREKQKDNNDNPNATTCTKAFEKINKRAK